MYIIIMIFYLLIGALSKEEWEFFWGAAFIIRTFFWPLGQMLSVCSVALVLINIQPRYEKRHCPLGEYR